MKKIRTFGRLFAECLFTAYLQQKLYSTNEHKYVYGLSHHWGRGRGLGRFRGVQSAAASVQDALIERHGYQQCPSCTWSTHSIEHHLRESKWCRETEEQRHSEEE